jgi:hypothetical protein
MTATNHAATGALIATVIKEPLLAVPISFLAHFAMDAIPHFGLSEKNVFLRNAKRTFWVVLWADLAIATTLLITLPLLITGASSWAVLLCMLACMSPDLVWGWRLLWEIKEKTVRPKRAFSRFHAWIQWREFPKGIYVEITWLAGVLSLIIKR